MPDKSASPCSGILGRQNDSSGDKITLHIPRPDTWEKKGENSFSRWSFTPCAAVSFLQVRLPFPPATENHPIVVPLFIVFRHWRFPGIHTLRCPCDINRINHTRATMGQQGVITVLTATMTRDFYFYWPRTTCVSAPLSSQGIEYLTSRADIVSARSIVRCLVKIFLFDGSPPLEKPNTISFDGNLLIFNKPRVLSSSSRGWLSMWAHSSHPIEDGRGVWFFPPRNLSVVSGSSPPQRIQQPVGFSSLWSNRFVYVA